MQRLTYCKLFVALNCDGKSGVGQGRPQGQAFSVSDAWCNVRTAKEKAMSDIQAFLFGVMTTLTPSMVILGVLLWRAPIAKE
jgi:hypothetical protein